MFIGKLKNVVLWSKWIPARNAFIFQKCHYVSFNIQFDFSISQLCNQLTKYQQIYIDITLFFNPHKVTWGPYGQCSAIGNFLLSSLIIILTVLRYVSRIYPITFLSVDMLQNTDLINVVPERFPIVFPLCSCWPFVRNL